jgi:hypothetical protein
MFQVAQSAGCFPSGRYHTRRWGEGPNSGGPRSIGGFAVRSPYATAPAWRSPYLVRPRRRRGLAGLGDASGAITGAEAFRQAKAAESNLNPRDYDKNPAFGEEVIGKQIENMQFPSVWTNPTGCSGQQAPKVSLFSTVTGVAAGVVGTVAPIATPSIAVAVGATTAAVSTAFAVATLGLGAIAAIFGIIWAHHRAAVQRDDAAECAIYPAMVNTLEAVRDAVQNGTLTPAQGIAALTPMPGMFVQYAGAAYNHHPYCNALCEAKLLLDAFCRYWIGQFQQMQAQQAAAGPAGSVTGAISSAAAQAGLPAWLLWGGLAWALWEFV